EDAQPANRRVGARGRVPLPAHGGVGELRLRAALGVDRRQRNERDLEVGRRLGLVPVHLRRLEGRPVRRVLRDHGWPDRDADGVDDRREDPDAPRAGNRSDGPGHERNVRPSLLAADGSICQRHGSRAVLPAPGRGGRRRGRRGDAGGDSHHRDVHGSELRAGHLRHDVPAADGFAPGRPDGQDCPAARPVRHRALLVSPLGRQSCDGRRDGSRWFVHGDRRPPLPDDGRLARALPRRLGHHDDARPEWDRGCFRCVARWNLAASGVPAECDHGAHGSPPRVDDDAWAGQPRRQDGDHPTRRIHGGLPVQPDRRELPGELPLRRGELRPRGVEDLGRRGEQGAHRGRGAPAHDRFQGRLQHELFAVDGGGGHRLDRSLDHRPADHTGDPGQPARVRDEHEKDCLLVELQRERHGGHLGPDAPMRLGVKPAAGMVGTTDEKEPGKRMTTTTKLGTLMAILLPAGCSSSSNGATADAGPAAEDSSVNVDADTDADEAGEAGPANGCVYPSGPYGTAVGKVPDPSMTWQGFAPGATTVSTVNITDFYDCDGSRGINALVVDSGAQWCVECQYYAPFVPTWMSSKGDNWTALGVRYLNLIIQDNASDPGTVTTAQQWRDQFKLTSIYVVADPTDSFPTNSLPNELLIDPRTMKVVGNLTSDTTLNNDGSDPKVTALAKKDGGK